MNCYLVCKLDITLYLPHLRLVCRPIHCLQEFVLLPISRFNIGYFKVFPDRIHITAVLVEYETATGRTNRGVATHWLSNKQPDNGIKPTVPIYVRKSQFRLPAQPQTPIIMIGPGTGLAPFRGFIQERHFQKEQGKTVISI